MLLIDDAHRVHSVTPDRAGVAFVPDPPARGHGAARLLLERFRHDWRFGEVLGRELARLRGTAQGSMGGTAGRFSAACRLAEDGAIRFARQAREDLKFRFDPICPQRQHATGAIVFPALDVAEKFSAALLQQDAHRKHAAAALGHHAGARFQDAGSKLARRAGADAGRGADAPDALALALAERLFRRELLLLPEDVSRLHFQLAWQAPSVTVSVERGPPPEPTPVAAAAYVPIAAPRSPMPVAPEYLTPQAVALKQAAKHGIPFCEECAKRAAELADAA